MPSKEPVEPIDIPEASPDEREALARARELNPMSSDEFLQFLLAFSRQHPPSRETNSPDDEPFSL